MTRTYLTLQPSEAVVVQGACQIYAAYISTGKVEEGQEDAWMARAIQETLKIARATDSAVIADDEMDTKEKLEDVIGSSQHNVQPRHG